MIEMSPAFAHDSNVGPVFEITAWSPTKSVSMGLLALVVATITLSVATFLWNPKLMTGKLPQGAEDVIGDAIKAQTTHRWKMRCAMAVAAGLGCLFGVASIASLRDGLSGNYYFRAGSGGLSLRLPHGLSWAHGGMKSAALELDLSWDEIEGLTVAQTKQLGSTSRNAGNLSADLIITLRSGKKHTVSLDGLKAPAYRIHERLNEARYMVVAGLDAQSSADWGVPQLS